MKALLVCLLSATVLLNPAASIAEPFSVSARLSDRSGSTAVLTIDVAIEDKSYLYGDKMIIESDSAVLKPISVPEGKKKYDQFEDAEVSVYTHSFTMKYSVAELSGESLSVTVGYQGCDATICYLPQLKLLKVTEQGAEVSDAPVGLSSLVPAQPGSEDGWESIAEDFEAVAHHAGYMSPKRFLEFLDAAESDDPAAGFSDALVRRLENSGMLLTMLLILLGGLALNLTPCVLPMIPINIAIIGAGAQAGSKARGFVLGGVYGLGIAVAYGALGVVCVKTGAAFGTLQSMPAFNFAIAGLFAVLSLAMFGVINIDFTKFQGSIGPKGQSGGHFAAAFFMGAVSALLAGACVAPVVIWVLVYSTNLYSQGYTAALMIPFVLGAGMALPWPFAGAGLSLLPKPGKWMSTVKHGFGILIVLFALYYGHEGYQLMNPKDAAADSHDGWVTSLDEGFRQAADEGKPVFVDFWATWCKSCIAMDKNTFPDPEVTTRLDNYIKIKFPAENPRDPEVERIMKYFDARGLPTYTIFRQKQDP